MGELGKYNPDESVSHGKNGLSAGDSFVPPAEKILSQPTYPGHGREGTHSSKSGEAEEG